MHHVLGFATLQVGPGQVVEVLLGSQYIGTLVIKVEKFLQVVEGIGAAQGFHIGPGQGDPVAFGQGEQQFRLQRALRCMCSSALGKALSQSYIGVVSIRYGSRHSTGRARQLRSPLMTQGRPKDPVWARGAALCHDEAEGFCLRAGSAGDQLGGSLAVVSNQALYI